MMTRRLGEGVADMFAPLLVLVTLAVATIAPAVAQLDQAKSTELQKMQEGAKSQAQIDKFDDERSTLEGQYRTTLTQLNNLREYNGQLRELIKAQDAEKISLREQIERITGVGREIVPLMNEMLTALDQFVDLDVPFLITERRARVNKLRALINQADVTDSEKYRRVLEAYQIENDYGRTIEAYDGGMDTEDGVQQVTYLKIGRVSFVYQTRDGSESYIWDQNNKSWSELGSSYRTPITIAIRMAREQIPPSLIYVPVIAPAAN
jgi:hypothetical protein